MLFNIYLNDLFLLVKSTEVCNFADYTTLFACEKDLNSLINRLEHDSLLEIEWFENNSYMKLNQEKCHLLVSWKKFENIWAKTWESPKQKFPDVVINRDLRFDEYVSSLCRKAGKKLSALARLPYYISLKQRMVLMEFFIEAYFGYCQLILDVSY